MIKKIIFLIFIFFGMALNIGCERIHYGYEDTYAYTVVKNTSFGDNPEFRDYLRNYSEIYKKYASNKTAEMESKTAPVAGPAVAGLMSAASPLPGFTNLSAGLLSFFFWSRTTVYDYNYTNIFYWKPAAPDQTSEEIHEWVATQFSNAVRAEVAKRNLFAGFNATESKISSEDDHTALAYNLGIHEGLPTFCKIEMYSRGDVFPVKEEAPAALGKGPYWVANENLLGYCYYKKKALFGYNTKYIPSKFVNYEFWVSLSKRLPPEIYIYIPPLGRYSQILYKHGEKLMHPVVLNQGHPHWFYPGAK